MFLFAAAAALGQSKPAVEVDPARCWTYDLGDGYAQSIAAGDGNVMLGFSEARVETVSLDGKKLWSSDFGGEIRSNIVRGDNGVYVVTANASSDKTRPVDAVLRTLSSDTGITVRTQKLGSAERYLMYAANGSLAVVASSGSIELYSEKDGTSLWRRDIASGFAGEPVFTDGKVTVATASDQLFVVSLLNGEIESMRKVAFPVTALVSTSDGGLIVGDARGFVLLVANGADKPEWKFKSGGSISRVANAGGKILAVSNDNFVYLLNDRNGDVIWKKRLPGRAADARVYGDKYVVVAGFEEHDALLLDVSKGKVAGQIKLAADETVIAIQTTSTSILVLTNNSLYSYALNGCAKT